MTEEQDIDLTDLGEDEEIRNKSVEKRIKSLSEKVRLTSEERDELARAKEQAELEKSGAIKERDFYASFADATAKYPEANTFKDSIKEKVMSGYTVEDATVAVLAKEGKLQNYTPPVEKETVAGGSAVNQPLQGGTKPLGEMTREEKRAMLLEAEGRGDISVQ